MNAAGAPASTRGRRARAEVDLVAARSSLRGLRTSLAAGLDTMPRRAQAHRGRSRTARLDWPDGAGHLPADARPACARRAGMADRPGADAVIDEVQPAADVDLHGLSGRMISPDGQRPGARQDGAGVSRRLMRS